MVSVEPIPLPEGMRWCPECNEEGEVWTMDATPDMDERRRDCTYPGCFEGNGMVPAEVGRASR